MTTRAKSEDFGAAHQTFRVRPAHSVLVASAVVLSLALTVLALIQWSKSSSYIVVIISAGSDQIQATTIAVALMSLATATFAAAPLVRTLAGRILIRIAGLLFTTLAAAAMLFAGYLGLNHYVHVGTLSSGERLVVRETTGFGNAIYAAYKGNGILFTPMSQVMDNSYVGYPAFSKGEFELDVAEATAELRYRLAPGGPFDGVLVIEQD